MNKEQLEAKSLGDLREIAKLQGVKSLTKYRKSELVEIIMGGGIVPSDFVPTGDTEAQEGEAEAQEASFGAQPTEQIPPNGDMSMPQTDSDGYRRSGYAPRPYQQNKPYYDNRQQQGGYQRRQYQPQGSYQQNYQQQSGYQQGGFQQGGYQRNNFQQNSFQQQPSYQQPNAYQQGYQQPTYQPGYNAATYGAEQSRI